ncbi:Pyruvate kinase [Mycena indigotica]|uniref:Pyruvate kinase n=1 Tax=Mycena indigotica TaxID=2126181 RepID=A0A8H6SVS8_9AGAR|nr:Pyruvate kinase [Mycena indigotica]KAF7306823.1 Pyruvate kinase [Mycena indigotica]
MSFTKRRSGSFRGRLPHHIDENKYHGRNHPWLIPIPGLGTRRLLLNPRRIHQFSISRFGRRVGFVLMLVGLASSLFATFTLISLAKRIGTRETTWPAFVQDPPTLVFRRADLQRIWKWELASGHYPSRRRVPEQIWLGMNENNPALPPRRGMPPPGSMGTVIRGVGAKRVYLDPQSKNVAFPPRPIAGSLADLDIVMEHCDFSSKKYVRDCLEVLRFGGGLDNGKRLRRGKMDDWKYIYLEQPDLDATPPGESDELRMGITDIAREPMSDPDSGLTRKKGVDWEPSINDQLPPPRKYTHATGASPCDPEDPRIFHMFWVGPFTDKPYMALMSFLFTQNTGLHLDDDADDETICRPVFWLWINMGPAAAVPNPSALHDMYSQLKSNPWAAPFLHPRFHKVIQFKLWNTTEQLDGVPELRDEWRSHADSLFNSGGHVINVPAKEKASSVASVNATQGTKSEEDEMLKRMGSKSSTSYDRMSVILSDMARFILCHRFGGIYLDADTILLRDWEELWVKMAFAYRWSRLEKYNTAVLHLNKGSALGTFLFRTALKNDLDFHPMTVSRYLKDAYLDGLLLRLPDALFDSAWLNTEYYQRDRPPQPYFTDFADFFDTPVSISAGPQSLGFDGFFKGAYSYHYHNYWWKPFDSIRNWPDLGPRFIAIERIARSNLRSASKTTSTASGAAGDDDDSATSDPRDLDWSMVLKRTFEAYIRGERPNQYGEWLNWGDREGT